MKIYFYIAYIAIFCFYVRIPCAEECLDLLWCGVKMPSVSSFRFFEPPTDDVRWRKAQIQAASGDHVLLEKISKVFPTPLDFLDGDRGFRSLHHIADVFVDESIWLTPLMTNGTGLVNHMRFTRKIGKSDQKWQKERRDVVPNGDDWIDAGRVPIVAVGYNAFAKDANTYFAGNYLGGAYVQKKDFLRQWNKDKDSITYPFIAMCSLNENWGWMSSHFPNRTAAWGSCCHRKKDVLNHAFLDHPKTVMLVINQHSNISHPKVLTLPRGLPRGLPLTWSRTKQIAWQAIRENVLQTKKTKLLFAAASSWGPRPQILRCVSDKFQIDEFEGHSAAPLAHSGSTRLDRREYYRKLAGSRFGLNLPGLGYDCFRLWELLTMGSIAVIERSVGFDRSLWKLPALLVDDFADVTPTLLRTAYVEALYHADEFEFDRLTMSFWWEVVFNVSVAGHVGPMLDRFPMAAEVPDFTRPRRPYPCGRTNTCGKGAKRTPAQSC